MPGVLRPFVFEQGNDNYPWFEYSAKKGQSASEKKQTELDNYLNYQVSQLSPRDPVEMIINERQMLRFHETKS